MEVNVIQMPLKKTDADRLRERALEMLRQADEAESHPELSVGDVLDVYEAEASHLTPNERRTVLAIHAHLRKHLGSVAASDLGQAVLKGYATKRLAEKTPRGTHPTPMSINAEMKRLAAAIGHAIDTKRMAANPLRRLPLLHVDRKRRAPWGEHELRLLIAASPADWYSVLLLARWELGGRPTETTRLAWADVDFEHGTITYRAENVKTRRSRTVPMTQRLALTLQEYRKHSAGKYLFEAPRTGEPYSTKYCSRLWHETVEASGLEAEGCCLTWHSVRAIANNSMKRRSVDVVERMLLLGHCSLAATEAYSDSSDEDMRAAVDRIERGALLEARKPPIRAARQFAERVLKRKPAKRAGKKTTKPRARRRASD